MPKTAEDQGSPPRFVLLDGMRGVAAFLVLLMHAASATVSTPIFDRGYLSVDLFFLLSGFVLTLAFEPRFAAGMGAWRFFRLRVARLWPTMAIGMGIGSILAVSLAPPDIAVRAVMLNLLLVPAQCGGKGLYCLNGPAWSLACELVANLVHVLVLWRLSDRWLGAIAGVSGLALGYAILLHGHADLGVDIDNALGGYLRCAFAYTLGILIARRWRVPSAGALPWWMGMAPAALLPFAFQLGEGAGLDRAVGDAIACLLAIPAGFWLATRSDAPRWLHPALAWLGARSYPLYAVNMPVTMLGLCAGVALGVPDGPVLMAGLVGAALAMAEVVHRVTATRRAAPPVRKPALAPA